MIFIAPRWKIIFKKNQNDFGNFQNIMECGKNSKFPQNIAKSLWWDIRNLTLWCSLRYAELILNCFLSIKTSKELELKQSERSISSFRNPYLNLSQRVQSCLSSPFKGTVSISFSFFLQIKKTNTKIIQNQIKKIRSRSSLDRFRWFLDQKRVRLL